MMRGQLEGEQMPDDGHAAAGEKVGRETTSAGSRHIWLSACLRPIVAAYGEGRTWMGSGRRERGRSEAPQTRESKGGAQFHRKNSCEDHLMHCAAAHGQCGQLAACQRGLNAMDAQRAEYSQMEPHCLSSSRPCPERYVRNRMRRSDDGPRRHSRNHSGTSTTTAAVFLTLLLTLTGDFSSLGLRSVQSLSLQPSFEWDGQKLYVCDIPKKDAETQCECYVYDPNAVIKCQTTPPEEAEATTLPRQQKSCTHDPKVQYACIDPNNPVCNQIMPCSGVLSNFGYFVC